MFFKKDTVEEKKGRVGIDIVQCIRPKESAIFTSETNFQKNRTHTQLAQWVGEMWKTPSKGSRWLKGYKTYWNTHQHQRGAAAVMEGLLCVGSINIYWRSKERERKEKSVSWDTHSAVNIDGRWGNNSEKKMIEKFRMHSTCISSGDGDQ